MGEDRLCYLTGFFCSLPCAARYVRDTQCERVKRLFYWVNLRNYRVIVQREAPPRHCLKEYGGKMTREQFKQVGQISQYTPSATQQRLFALTGGKTWEDVMKVKYKLSRALRAHGLEKTWRGGS